MLKRCANEIAYVLLVVYLQCGARPYLSCLKEYRLLIGMRLVYLINENAKPAVSLREMIK